ncbi:mucin-17-like [Tribolium madens]|uniref:mucin-17-like n=1 Tax=Tribolium madens TaxID=41895 RepID=UPI001CF73A28|nr:mucin-17-like [Tribolium madens]
MSKASRIIGGVLFNLSLVKRFSCKKSSVLVTCASFKHLQTPSGSKMGHFETILILLLSLQPWETVSITRRVRNFHPPTDWELGLRESVHQALLREHYTDPGLRDRLLAAPFINRQDNASPFGDIAVLARGQLYITPEGFKFVQDVDCDCQRCLTSPQCQWKTFGHHKLLALWTVKRIRHRDPHYGHMYEIEYTISPITHTISEDLVKRHGFFNYNVPGHIFVIKIDPGVNTVERNEWYKKEGDHGHFKPGILIQMTPDGYKHVLHSFPGFFTSYHDQTTIDPKEYELYKKLIESLAAKTSNGPHRFSVTTPATTTFIVSEGQFVPITTLPTQSYTKSPEPPKPITTIHYYTPVETTKPTTEKQDEDFDIFSEPIRTTTKKITSEEHGNLFSVVSPTEPMKPFTEVPKHTRPDSISEQLPAPDRNIETTIPYVTTTQPSTRKEESTTIEKVPYTEQKTAIIGPFTTEKVKSTTFYTTIPKTSTYGTTVIEAVPVRTLHTSTSPKTTLLAVASTKPTSYGTTVIKAVPVRTLHTSTITKSSHGTTSLSASSPKTTTIEAVPVRTLHTSTSTTFLPSSPKSYGTTVVEKVPVRTLHTSTSPRTSSYRTTVIEEVPVRTSTTIKAKPVTLPERDTTVIEAVPVTTLHSSTSPRTSYSTTVIEAAPITTPFLSTSPGTTTIETVPITTLHASTSPKSTYDTTLIEATVPKTSSYETTIAELVPTTPRGQTTRYGTTLGDTESLTTHPKPTTITEFYFKSTPKTSQQFTIPTTTYYTETPTQYLNETTYTTKKVPRVTITTPSDGFLLDSGSSKKPKLPEKKDFDVDDIFGTVLPKSSTEPMETTTKQLVQSDISRALFGRSKQVKISSKVRKSSTNRPKIIYGNFYAPSTPNPNNTLLGTTVATTEIRPSTDQSISTSITFEVNKRNKVKLSKTENEKKTETTTAINKSETKKVFDDLALQLVNHARTIDYLQKKPSRQPKYRRRSFTTRKRSQRKNTKSAN